MLKISLIIFFGFFLLITENHASVSNKNLSSYTRNQISLNGEWKAIVDPYETGYYNIAMRPHEALDPPPKGAYFTNSKMTHPSDRIEYDFDKSLSLEVPGDWNTQKEKLYYYEGTVWYRKMFNSPKLKPDERVFLEFDAVNYKSEVYLNGKKLGTHIGGFTPFHFEITNKIQNKDNYLVVKVDNSRHPNSVPTTNMDWWNYGGITRDVSLLVLPKAFVRDVSVKLNSYQNKEITTSVLVDGAQTGTKVTLTVPELNIKQISKTDIDGKASFSFSAPKATLWSPNNPKLYQFHFKVDKDIYEDRFGLRTVSTNKNTLLLNGEPIFLRGISVHEEYAVDGGGRVKNRTQSKHLLEWAKELNVNFIRLAHYPHNEDMVREAEKMGILLWKEIPVYWAINWENQETYENAKQQLVDMIGRDKNRAAVIIWSIANETPNTPPRLKFLQGLAAVARQIDGTRLISAAMLKEYKDDDRLVVHLSDPLLDIVDIVAFNQYIGWYDGTPEKLKKVSFKLPVEKPIIISEFGGGAKFGLHGSNQEIWTEKYQEEIYINQLDMITKIEGLVGISPWILTDFRSPRRPLPLIQDDFNRKGLYSEKGEKKKAFYILKNWYTKILKNKITDLREL